MLDRVGLYIGAEAYEGWERVSIQRSLMSLSGSFEVSLADQQAGRDWNFGALQDCAVTIGQDRLLTGFIDSVELSVGADSHQVQVKGRDLTADLVDCAVVADRTGKPFSGTLKRSDLLAIAKTLMGPFGLVPAKGADLGAIFKRFAIQRGETVFEALDRACKLRGIIAITDPYGILHLTVSGSARAVDTLRYGVNVKAGRSSYEYTNRFSHYRVETQVAGEGEEVGSVWGRTTDVSASFIDKEVAAARFRPTILSADADSSLAACRQRVAAEALFRAANSQTFEVDVVGWRQSDGKTLWQVNQVVAVDIPALYLKEDLLIVQANYQQSREEGSTTTLTLMRKDAFNAARALEAQQIQDPPGVRSHWNSAPKLPASRPPASGRPPSP